MTPKGWGVLAFLVITVVCFLLVGFGHGDAWTGHDLIGVGLAAEAVAFGIHVFARGPEVNP